MKRKKNNLVPFEMNSSNSWWRRWWFGRWSVRDKLGKADGAAKPLPTTTAKLMRWRRENFLSSTTSKMQMILWCSCVIRGDQRARCKSMLVWCGVRRLQIIPFFFSSRSDFFFVALLTPTASCLFALSHGVGLSLLFVVVCHTCDMQTAYFLFYLQYFCVSLPLFQRV